MRKLTGQTLLEYTILISITATALMGMTIFMKRGIQSVVKLTADQLADQNAADVPPEPGEGYLVNIYAITRQRQVSFVEGMGNSLEYSYGQELGGGSVYQTISSSDTLINLGFRNVE